MILVLSASRGWPRRTSETRSQAECSGTRHPSSSDRCFEPVVVRHLPSKGVDGAPAALTRVRRAAFGREQPRRQLGAVGHQVPKKHVVGLVGPRAVLEQQHLEVALRAAQSAAEGRAGRRAGSLGTGAGAADLESGSSLLPPLVGKRTGVPPLAFADACERAALGANAGRLPFSLGGDVARSASKSSRSVLCPLHIGAGAQMGALAGATGSSLSKSSSSLSRSSSCCFLRCKLAVCADIRHAR